MSGQVGTDDRRRLAIARSYRKDETTILRGLLRRAGLEGSERAAIARTARRLVSGVRKRSEKEGGLDAFLTQYALSTREGVVLMSLAEALLRIPDDETRDRLIRDKLADTNWESHLGRSGSILVNASTVGLLLTGKVIRLDDGEEHLSGLLGRAVARLGEPVIRAALEQAMQILGGQFVMGKTIADALERVNRDGMRRWRYSFDMLGEAALTQPDSERYFDSYAHAIEKIGAEGRESTDSPDSGISVKLSALHPRYEYSQSARVLEELVPRLAELARLARDAGIGLTIDAEEADRLDLSLDVIERVFADDGLGNWNGFGVAVQAYQRRAVPVLDWLGALSRRVRRPLNIRLVKGAYWDTEIKRAQEQGFDSYPVFTRKASTDVSYIACIRWLFAAKAPIFPQFATHNAHTVAVIRALAPKGALYEFQRLHGMGDALYETVSEVSDVPCRVYAPVGRHEDLLPYLVRRLLENGANSSFVNRLAKRDLPISEVIADPITKTVSRKATPSPDIPSPRVTLEAGRIAAAGLDLSDRVVLNALVADIAAAEEGGNWQAGPIVDGKPKAGKAHDVAGPADRGRKLGFVADATEDDVEGALHLASASARDWDGLGGTVRADIIEKAADRIEADLPLLMALAVREGGKTIGDALAEVRETVDFCRYYASRTRSDFAKPVSLPGPTGERNTLSLRGRGIFACISPWNFPMAIFCGQVAAALAAGNAVIAKPAEQTPLAAAAIVRHLLAAGVPGSVLHLLPGDGATIGGRLVADRRVDGIAFTGSIETAKAINRTLADRDGAIVPLIAETGGLNAMIVDSSALAEQVVKDVITSAFRSAGQRCSALRVLFLQEQTADRIIKMLCGAMEELVVGDPGSLATDIGPVIDNDALATLESHATRMARDGNLLYRVPVPHDCAEGSFFGPAAFEIDGLARLEGETFGPILHIVRYRSDRLDDVIAAINDSGYGLTAGVHSRIQQTIRYISDRLHVGNAYANRSMIGAVVGVQPFGGEGLSGTGPKAGGPHYLNRFAVERVLSVNTAAVGGNIALMARSGDEPEGG